MSTDTQGISDEQLIEHLHARGWNVGTIDVPMIREGAAALQAEALAAIKAALDLGIELTWQKMIMEIAGDSIDDMDSPLSAKVRELSARADAIRRLGEDAGRDGND